MNIKRLTNKQLVRFLMDYRGIKMISITDQFVIAEVSTTFKPSDGVKLCAAAGHPDARPATTQGRNFITFKRF